MTFQEWLQQNPIYAGQVAEYQRNGNYYLLNPIYEKYQRESRVNQANDIISNVQSGQLSGNEALGQLGQSGLSLNPYQEQYINNVIAQNSADASNAFTEHMRDTSITSAAQQYSSLGFNSGAVLSNGGAGIGSSAAANTSKDNIAADKALNEFNQKAQTTRTLLSILGGLASAGVFGGFSAYTRLAAAKLAASTAHSAESITKSYDGRGSLTGWTTTSREWK